MPCKIPLKTRRRKLDVYELTAFSSGSFQKQMMKNESKNEKYSAQISDIPIHNKLLRVKIKKLPVTNFNNHNILSSTSSQTTKNVTNFKKPTWMARPFHLTDFQPRSGPCVPEVLQCLVEEIEKRIYGDLDIDIYTEKVTFYHQTNAIKLLETIILRSQNTTINDAKKLIQKETISVLTRSVILFLELFQDRIFHFSKPLMSRLLEQPLFDDNLVPTPSLREILIDAAMGHISPNVDTAAFMVTHIQTVSRRSADVIRTQMKLCDLFGPLLLHFARPMITKDVPEKQPESFLLLAILQMTDSEFWRTLCQALSISTNEDNWEFLDEKNIGTGDNHDESSAVMNSSINLPEATVSPIIPQKYAFGDNKKIACSPITDIPLTDNVDKMTEKLYTSKQVHYNTDRTEFYFNNQNKKTSIPNKKSDEIKSFQPNGNITEFTVDRPSSTERYLTECKGRYHQVPMPPVIDPPFLQEIHDMLTSPKAPENAAVSSSSSETSSVEIQMKTAAIQTAFKTKTPKLTKKTKGFKTKTSAEMKKDFKSTLPGITGKKFGKNNFNQYKPVIVKKSLRSPAAVVINEIRNKDQRLKPLKPISKISKSKSKSVKEATNIESHKAQLSSTIKSNFSSNEIIHFKSNNNKLNDETIEASKQNDKPSLPIEKDYSNGIFYKNHGETIIENPNTSSYQLYSDEIDTKYSPKTSREKISKPVFQSKYFTGDTIDNMFTKVSSDSVIDVSVSSKPVKPTKPSNVVKKHSVNQKHTVKLSKSSEADILMEEAFGKVRKMRMAHPERQQCVSNVIEKIDKKLPPRAQMKLKPRFDSGDTLMAKHRDRRLSLNKKETSEKLESRQSLCESDNTNKVSSSKITRRCNSKRRFQKKVSKTEVA